MSENDREKNQEQNRENEKGSYEDVCFICRRPESKVEGRIYRLPNGICICEDSFRMSCLSCTRTIRR